MTIKNNPIQCKNKLTVFGVSRSLICQTRTVCSTRTKKMQRGTLLYVIPEQLPVKFPIKQARQEDLLQSDIWEFDITFFCFVNPGLNAPFKIKFDRMTDISEFNEEFIANYLDARKMPAMLDRYYFQRQIYQN